MDIYDFTDRMDFKESDLDEITDQLLKEGKIYEFANLESYLKNVKNKGFISFCEKQ